MSSPIGGAGPAFRLRRAARREGFTSLTVSGFKSIGTQQEIDIRPLTILAGANNAGKSSILQPLLLLKQTLESGFDPGALLLSGENVKFTESAQFFSKAVQRGTPFCLGLKTGGSIAVHLEFSARRRVELDAMHWECELGSGELRPDMRGDELEDLIRRPPDDRRPDSRSRPDELPPLTVRRDRCFLTVEGRGLHRFYDPQSLSLVRSVVEPLVREVIHLPGLRGNPERTYPATAVGDTFPGTFESYTASMIARWQESADKTPRQVQLDEERLGALREDLSNLGLTWKVEAKGVSETQVQVMVGRLARAVRGGARDLVSVADVGLGVSQTLPVLVALQAARQGQLVYLEQPEIHLHPKAQVALADVLARAAARGVRVVVETHSSLLILGIQARIAEGALSPSLVKLHWFERDESGATSVVSADLDDSGAFGDWPADFDDIALEAQSRYLEAAFDRLSSPRARG